MADGCIVRRFSKNGGGVYRGFLSAGNDRWHLFRVVVGHRQSSKQFDGGDQINPSQSRAPPEELESYSPRMCS